MNGPSPRVWAQLPRTRYRVQVFMDGVSASFIQVADAPEEAARLATGQPLALSGPSHRLRAKVCPLQRGPIAAITCFYEPEEPAFPEPDTLGSGL